MRIDHFNATKMDVVWQHLASINVMFRVYWEGNMHSNAAVLLTVHSHIASHGFVAEN